MAHFRVETQSERRLLLRNAVTAAPKHVVLRGRIVTMNARAEVIPDGMVCIQDDLIVQVGAWSATLPPPFAAAPVFNTAGTIYPGLIELHNHPAYNVVPMWAVPQHFDNRSLWRTNDNYKRRVFNPGNLLTYHPKEIYPKALVRFVECKALLGGVTTTQGFVYKSGDNRTAYFEGLVRNVEFPNKGWPVASDSPLGFSETSASDLLSDRRRSPRKIGGRGGLALHRLLQPAQGVTWSRLQSMRRDHRLDAPRWHPFQRAAVGDGGTVRPKTVVHRMPLAPVAD